jgi:hypothetical protein
MTENRIFCVTLAFNPPGPLHSSLLIAPDETMAAALAMQSAMAVMPEHASLVGTAVFVVDPDVLRQMLRAVEGKGTGEVLSLVPKAEPNHVAEPGGGWRRLGEVVSPIEQRAAEILRQHPEADCPVPDLSWARPDALAASQAWENYRHTHPEVYGPPMPEPAA